MAFDLIDEIKTKLNADYSFKARGDYLIQGKCPKCGQKQLFCRAEKPFYLVCNRKNECQYEANIKEIYPEIFEDWSKRFPPTPQNPNATADNYLKYDRAIDFTQFKNDYTQEVFKDYNSGATTATIRFHTTNGAMWERFLDKEHRFGRKANFKGSYGGFWWQPSKFTIENLAKANEIWICEGIFDAMSLISAGQIAVSAMTTNNYPKTELNNIIKFLADSEIPNRPTLVFAYDLGAAGQKAIIEQIEIAKKDGWNAIGANPTNFDGKFPDWNDLHKSGRLDDEHIKEYLWNGAVLCAEDATEKASLLVEKKGIHSFHFAFKGRTYWAQIDSDKANAMIANLGLTEKAAARKNLAISEIASCEFSFLYFQRDHIIDETNYYLRVKTPRGFEITATFSGAALAGGAKFKERLLSVAAGAQWTGTTQQLESIVRDETRFIKTITTIDFIGYSPDHNVYLLGDFAIRDGRIIKANKDKYFDFGKEQIKLRAEKSILKITFNESQKFDWYDKFYAVFREKGIICLTFWIMTLFAEQIREKHQSLFFLEVTGVGGSGKTLLLNFLWKLFGRAGYEGLNPNKGSFAAVARNMAKTSNMPVVLMEGDTKQDNGHQKVFDYDILKDAYDGNPVYSRGVKNSGTDTYEPPFRGGMVIVQNECVKASPPTLERICATAINKETWWTPKTKEMSDEIGQWPADELSGSIVHFIKNEKKFLETFFEKMPFYEARFWKNENVRVKNQRLRKNHGQLHAAIDAIFTGQSPIFPIPNEHVTNAHKLVDEMAMFRDNGLQDDDPILAAFWEQIDYLETFEISGDFTEMQNHQLPVNLHNDPDNYFALNISHYEAFCRKHYQNPKDMDAVRKCFKNSKSRKFIDNKNYRCIDDKPRSCWIFEQPKRG